MSAEPRLSMADVEPVAKLINGFGILGSQLQSRQRPDLYQRAVQNLVYYRQHHGDLLARLHAIARKTKDESPKRLIEDFDMPIPDAMTYLALARRCLLVCAFLGHCLTMIATVQPAVRSPAPQQILHTVALLVAAALPAMGIAAAALLL
jgi:hypothetical protein